MKKDNFCQIGDVLEADEKWVNTSGDSIGGSYYGFDENEKFHSDTPTQKDKARIGKNMLLLMSNLRVGAEPCSTTIMKMDGM